MESIVISGVGMYVPDKIFTNKDIEDLRIGASAEWIYENLGVVERRIANKEQHCGDISSFAAINALKNAGIEAEDIDLLIMSTSTPDYVAPHTSSIVKKKIEANNAACFDLQAGCAGFVYSLISAFNYSVNDEEYSNILVVGGDVISKVTDWTNKKTCSGIGDGAGAFVLQKTGDKQSVKSYYIYHEDMPQVSCGYIPALYGNVQSSSQAMYNFDGRYLYERLVECIPMIVAKVLKKAGWMMEEVDVFVFPQTNKNLIKDITHVLDIPNEKVHKVMEKYGYTFNACVPITIYDAVMSNKLTKGKKVVIIGAGAGNYYAGIAIEW